LKVMVGFALLALLLFAASSESTQHPPYTPGGSRDSQSCYREDLFKDCHDDHLVDNCNYRVASIPTRCSVLKLSYGGLGDVGAVAVAEELWKTSARRVHTVHMDINDIGDKGAIAIADLIEHQKEGCAEGQTVDCGVHTWMLDDNDIGDRAANYLADALEKNKLVVELDLSNNLIDNQGTATLSHALRNNHHLTKMDFRFNRHTDEYHMDLLHEIIRRNRHFDRDRIEARRIERVNTVHKKAARDALFANVEHAAYHHNHHFPGRKNPPPGKAGDFHGRKVQDEL